MLTTIARSVLMNQTEWVCPLCLEYSDDIVLLNEDGTKYVCYDCTSNLDTMHRPTQWGAVPPEGD